MNWFVKFLFMMKLNFATFFLLLNFSQAAFAADLNTNRFLPNADFGEGKEAPAVWKLSKDSKNLRLVRDTQSFKGGPASLRLENTGGVAEGDALTDLWQSVPQGEFTLSGFAKASGNWEKAQLSIQSLNQGFGGMDWIVTHEIKPSTEWQPFSTKIKLNKDAAFALLHLIVKGEGTIHLDDFKIQTADAPSFNATADKKPVATMPVRYSSAQLHKWEQVFIGAGGTPTVLAQHPRDPDVLYAGMDVGGPMRRDGKNNRWIPLVDFLGPNQIALYHVESLALDANDANVIYYSAGKEWQNGAPSILKSANRGHSWTIVPLKNRKGKPVFITNGRTGQRLQVNPNNSQLLFYGSRKDGLFKSDNAGKSWQQITDFPVAGQPPDGMSISFVQFDKANRLIYVQAMMPKDSKAASGLYRSSDGGQGWQLIEGAPPGIGKLDSQGTLYIAGKTLQRYKNGEWENITPPGASDFSALAISPADPNLIALARDHCGGGNALYRSKDGGKTWTEFNDNDFERGKKTSLGQLQPWEGGNNGAHAYACASDFTFDGNSPKKLWMTNWPGVWSCRDFTEDVLHWRAEVEGHEEVCLFDLACPPKSKNGTGAPLISGMMDVGGFRHADVNQMPSSQMVGIKTPYNNAPEDITDIDFCETEPNFIAVVGGWKYQDWMNGPKNAAAGFSLDNGRTWQNFASVPFKEARGGRVAVNAANEDNIVWIPRDNLNGTNKGNTPVYFSKDRGKTWTAAQGAPFGLIFGEFVYTFYQPLESDRVQANTFYIWDRRDGRFYRSNDGGATWKHTATLPAQPGAHFDRHTVRAAPGLKGEVWIAADNGGLFRSIDGGENWTKLNGIEKAWAFGWGAPLAPNAPPIAYLLGRVASSGIKEVAMYRSLDKGATWQLINDPQTQGWGQATVVNGDRQTPGRVYVGTNGRGIFYGDAPRKGKS